MGGYEKIIAQKPQSWKAENFANDSAAGRGRGQSMGCAAPETACSPC